MHQLGCLFAVSLGGGGRCKQYTMQGNNGLD
jgi:hypothetical protein